MTECSRVLGNVFMSMKHLSVFSYTCAAIVVVYVNMASASRLFADRKLN